MVQYKASKGITNAPELHKTGIDLVVEDDQGYRICFSGFNLTKDGNPVKFEMVSLMDETSERYTLVRICNDLIKLINGDSTKQLRKKD